MKRDLDDDDEDDDDEGAGQASGIEAEPKSSKPAAPAADKKGKKPSKKAAGSLSSSLGSGGVDAALNRCTVTVTLPLHSPKLLMLEIVERVAASTMVRSTSGIDKVQLTAWSLPHFNRLITLKIRPCCLLLGPLHVPDQCLYPPHSQVYVVEGQGEGEDVKVQTDGINFEGAWNNADIVDVNRIITNDVAATLNT